MHRIRITLVGFLACSALWVQAQPSSAVHARSLAATCANCHGTDGRSDPGHARLAGRSKGELLGMLQAFKSGAVPSTVMQQLAKGYTDAQLETLADYFAGVSTQSGDHHAAP